MMVKTGPAGWGRVGLLLGLAVLLAGCVWLRLLETKGQLEEFDHHFRVEVTDSFTLHFLHPVLFDEDLTELAEVAPTQLETLPSGETRWTEVFHKTDVLGKREAPERTIWFQQRFNAEHKMIAWTFSPLFMDVAPPRFLEASLRSLGKGTIFQSRHQLTVNPEDIPKFSAALPDLKAIRGLLGTPIEERKDGDAWMLVYRFDLDTPTPATPANEKRRIALVKLYFDEATGALNRFSGRFIGLRLSINYRNFIPSEHEEATGAGEP